MKTAILKYSVDYHTHQVKLTNRDGHSFSAKSEGLTDFISYEDNYNSKNAGIDLIVKDTNNHDRLVEELEECKLVFHEYGMIGRVNKIEQLLTELKA